MDAFAGGARGTSTSGGREGGRRGALGIDGWDQGKVSGRTCALGAAVDGERGLAALAAERVTGVPVE